jgi:EAL domain-containing protein (putative c-di-GMP-specific phosphodiesterase class I)
MHKLKRLGFTIALDDFGTGHSSLSYLKKFPIDRLKIDRSFVVDIEHSEQDRNITATIIRLAKYLNIDVVAEGVETEAQSYFLHVMGCDVVQGYFFSKPLPCDQLEKFIDQTKVLINQPKSN